MEETREHARFPHLFSSLALRSVTLRTIARVDNPVLKSGEIYGWLTCR